MANGSDPDLEKLVAELRDRVEARRNAGAYPDDLEESLEQHFTQLIGPRSRVAPQAFDELDSQIRDLGEYEFSRTRIASSSGVPGGALAHRLVNRALSRAIDGVLAQSQEQQVLLTGVLALLSEIASSIASGGEQVVAQQLDDLQQRLAEHTRSLNELDRRVGDVAARVPGAGVDTYYDETHFTQRFRGGADDLRARYADLVTHFEGCSPVLDIGFGRGELMELLADMGLEVSGIEVDPHLVALARGRGLDVAGGTAVEHLRTLAPESLGGISMIQVIEHLSPQQVIDVVELCAEKVRPGGKVIIETVNPESLFTYARSFWLDPDHVRPVHRGLLEFLFTEAGFQKLEVEWRSPVPANERLVPVPGDDAQARAINENFDRIDRLLFGAQDYALIATR
ncbi:MAG TPA: methyltransferase domain-containing protein [Acidimicrobiia bacterium]|nr:methyltransferase domain-containing protein [Acidimicrobiia bacterium]